jgi:flagellar biosynthesis/type III secretory pathway protein FliH
MSSHVSTNNELLTLWLKASGGLPADEARDLIERVADLEAQRADDEMNGVRLTQDDIDKAYDEGHADALDGSAAYDEGRSAGHAEGRATGYAAAVRDVQRIINGPGWGRKPTLANIIADINQLVAEQRASA